MSLGCTTASRFSRTAFDYATSRNVLAVSASANEFSYHHNFQSIFDDVVAVGAVVPNNRNIATTWLQKANFANYGSHLDIVGPTDVPGASMSQASQSSYTSSASGTSSSTPHAAGVGALIFSRARDLIDAGVLPTAALGLKDISTLEVHQIMNRTADDVVQSSGTSYPVSTGWDKWTGYGRVNAKRSLDMVTPLTIPPEADINSPDWYTLVDGQVPVRFYANARWASTYVYTLEFGREVEPTSWTALGSVTATASNPSLSSANRASNYTTNWNVGALPNDLYTLRLRVTDNLGNVGEDRMAVWVRHADPADLPGFPKVFDGSGESLSVATVDLNGDNKLEIIFADGNGEVHAVDFTGAELPGFPVHTNLPPNLPLTTSLAFDGNPANGEASISYSTVIGGVAVADLDRDGVQQIVVGGTDGRVYCWNADASVCAGFPVAADAGFSRHQYPPNAQVQNNHPEGIAATPALGDLTGDGKLEIVVGSIDQKLYVWDSAGARVAPFPKQIFDPVGGSVSALAPRAILSSAAVADVDRDGANDIVVGTNEVYSTPAPPGSLPAPGGSGRAYLIKSNGAIAPGWPVRPTSISPNPVRLVAEGVGASPVVADLNGDGRLESGLTLFLGDAAMYQSTGAVLSTMSGAFGSKGPGSLDTDETTPEGQIASAADEPGHFYVANGAFADIDGDGRLDYTAGSVGNRILAIASGSGSPAPFDHLLSVWDAATGAPRPAFPRTMEDWQFLNSPAVADISGDNLPEIIDSSGGFFVHAFNALGQEPSGWPKNTGQWQTSTPSMGDIDSDGDLEVVQTSRLGGLFVWSTSGNACQKEQWRKFRHDEWNTGNYHADTRRPARITMPVLSVAGDALSLRWTAVGDDGKCGTATSYELRTSNATLTEGNFASGLLIPSSSPKAAGGVETLVFYPPADTRSIGLRAIDEAGNRGPLIVIPVTRGQIFKKKYVALTDPVRVLDTRTGAGGVAGPIGPGGTAEVTVAGVAGVPSDAVAVVMNVTAVDPTENTHFTVYPTGDALPNASTINVSAGRTIANLSVMTLGASGQVSINNVAGRAHAIFDVFGWISSGATDVAGGAFSPVETPGRILDTRNGTGGFSQPVGPGGEISIDVLNRAGVPANAAVVALNVTAVDTTAPGHLTLYPAGRERPNTSNLNFLSGDVVPNLVFARVGVNGKVTIYNAAGTTHLVVDVAGWIGDASSTLGGSIESLPPSRILDSRTPVGGVNRRLGPGESVSINVLNQGGIPGLGVAAVVLNVVAVDPDAPSHFTVYPAEPRPNSSNLNFAGRTVAGLVVVKVGPDGRVVIFNNSGTTHAIFDVAGWIASG